jgi:DnaK suppressor protein
MDGKTLEQIRESLMQRWKKVEKSTELQSLEDLDASNTPQAEIIDIAQSLEQLGRDASLQQQERRELVAIERALAKMSTGSFGICEDCGEAIPPKRLMVLPEARLCAICQTYEERQNARIARNINTASR